MIKLHEDYAKETHKGCLNRAFILYCFLKSKGFNPNIKMIEINVDYAHHFVIEKNNVYDPNQGIDLIPKRKYQYPEKKMGNSEKFIRDNCNFQFFLGYLPRFDLSFQESINPLMEKYGRSLCNR